MRTDRVVVSVLPGEERLEDRPGVGEGALGLDPELPHHFSQQAVLGLETGADDHRNGQETWEMASSGGRRATHTYAHLGNYSSRPISR